MVCIAKCSTNKRAGMRTKEDNSNKHFHYIFRSIYFLITKTKWRFLLFILCGVVFGIVSTGVSYVVKLIIDSVEVLISNPEDKSVFFKNLGLLFCISALNLYLQTFFNSINIAFSNQANKILMQSLINKSLELGLIKFESVQLYKNLRRAEEAIPAVVGIGIVSAYIPFLFSRIMTSGLYFLNQSPILALSLVIITMPVLVVRLIRGKTLFKLEFKKSEKKRILDYFDSCLMDKEYFKESRILGLEPYITKKWKSQQRLVEKEEWKTNRKLLHIQFIMLLLKYLGLSISFGISAFLLLNRTITLGTFSMSMSLMFFMQWTIERFVSQIGDALEKSYSAMNYFSFIDNEVNNPIEISEFSTIQKNGIELQNMKNDIITVKNVSFRYPFSNRKALCGINLSVKLGETLALVGVNGSGKTTLSKLLLGLLSPDSGKILFSDDAKKSSAVFQNFTRYNLTLKENIILGEVKRLDDDIAIEKLMNTMDIKEDPKQLLGKEWGGKELSGGVWQRIAIARGLFRNHKLIVLDEPTAALDPLFEAYLFKKFKEISHDTTSIIITHRLGAAKIADRIILVQDGQIIESGSHDQLIKYGGVYKQMFTSQAAWYN